MPNLCEDYPCCGHTSQDPCERQPYDEPGYFDRHPEALYEPGSPEWYDALDECGTGDPDCCDLCGEPPKTEMGEFWDPEDEDAESVYAHVLCAQTKGLEVA